MGSVSNHLKYANCATFVDKCQLRNMEIG